MLRQTHIKKNIYIYKYIYIYFGQTVIITYSHKIVILSHLLITHVILNAYSTWVSPKLVNKHRRDPIYLDLHKTDAAYSPIKFNYKSPIYITLKNKKLQTKQNTHQFIYFTKRYIWVILASLYFFFPSCKVRTRPHLCCLKEFASLSMNILRF